MARYTSRQSVWDAALGKFADFGFSMKEPDDHVVELYFKGDRIAIYTQSALTAEQLQRECQNFLNNTAAWS